jgi:hypothetical protein
MGENSSRKMSNSYKNSYKVPVVTSEICNSIVGNILTKAKSLKSGDAKL